MSRRDEVHAALRSVIDPGDRVVVVHSSLFAFRTPVDGLRADLLSALRRLVDEGLTVALPAVTFEYCRTHEYHHARSAPGTGVLVEWFLDLPEVRRTPHPVYSFAVAGPLGDALVDCRSDAAFGEGTVFEVFERERTRIVTLGADWNSCTQVHRYEELAGVPYRHAMTVAGRADFGDGPVPVDLRMVVRDTALRAALDFTPLFDALRAGGAVRTAGLLGAQVESVGVADLRDTARRVLADDPWILLRDPRVAEHRARLLTREPLRIALLGSRNLDVLARAFTAEGERLLDVEPFRLHVPPYGQLAREAHDPDSALHRFDPHVSFFVDRLEDVLGVDHLDDLDPADGDRLAAAVRAHVAQVTARADRCDRPVFVATFAVLRPGLGTAADLVAEANRLLADRLAGRENVHLLDLAEVIARHAGGPLVDDRLWLVGRVPHGASFAAALARRLWGLVLAVTGRTARLVVTDLDNTLWHGVVGDDGIEGIEVGPDHPGNAHLRLQRALRALNRQGVALAVCSKNDPRTALRALREHSGMVLREEDFAAVEIGWRPKAEAIADIADRLNLGLANVLFLDDNPVERAHVRRLLPEVVVPELPADAAGYADALLDHPATTVFAVTEEDRGRAARYRERGRAEAARRSFDRVEDFYASLGTRIHLAPLTGGNTARAAQLAAKTNQFNTTTRRHPAGELRRLAAAPDADVLVIGVEDRFSSREDVGLLVLLHDRARAETAVDAYVLSCRVLGRGIEAGVLRWLAGRLAADGVERLTGTVVPTERNGPCRTVFADAGFAAGDAPDTWHLALDAAAPAPRWLEFADHTQEEVLPHA